MKWMLGVNRCPPFRKSNKLPRSWIGIVVSWETSLRYLFQWWVQILLQPTLVFILLDEVGGETKKWQTEWVWVTSKMKVGVRIQNKRAAKANLAGMFCMCEWVACSLHIAYLYRTFTLPPDQVSLFYPKSPLVSFWDGVFGTAVRHRLNLISSIHSFLSLDLYSDIDAYLISTSIQTWFHPEGENLWCQ